MMKNSKEIILLCIAILVIISCKDPYYPNIEDKGISYLVVEGTIFNGNAITLIKLSRTVDLSTKIMKIETGAVVTVEDEENRSYRLWESGNGTYSATLGTLQAGNKYRLRIKTKDGKEYLSDFTEMKATPEIDDINWQKNSEGLSIRVNTHNDQNDTRYYRWEYEQTWEFHSSYVSNYDYVNEKIIDRPNEPDIFRCWRNANSNSVLIGSTANLSQDRIDNYTLIQIPANSWQLSVLYSVLVKQYALTEQEYQYWQKIKKNTEDLGSIFDPQPSEIPGNIKCIAEPGEQVIGYIGACIPREKRIFISNTDVSPWRYLQSCFTVDVPDNPDSLRVAFGGGTVDPIDRYSDGGKSRYTGAETTCIDCTLRGSNIKPSFWP